MAGSIASLNFKFTADIKGVQKAMRDAEKSLRAATSSFSQIGNTGVGHGKDDGGEGGGSEFGCHGVLLGFLPLAGGVVV